MGDDRQTDRQTDKQTTTKLTVAFSNLTKMLKYSGEITEERVRL
jgi:hypothetical protein